MTFGELLLRHPKLSLDLLRRHRGDFAAAARNWRDLERQLVAEGKQVEEARIAEHFELFRKSGNAHLLLEGISSDAHACDFAPLHIRSVLGASKESEGVS